MIKKLITVLIIGLILINLAFFVSSIRLSDEIATFEHETQKLHEQNIDLQKEVARFDSFQYAASMAAELNFIKQSTPLYIDNTKYAQLK